MKKLNSLLILGLFTLFLAACQEEEKTQTLIPAPSNYPQASSSLPLKWPLSSLSPNQLDLKISDGIAALENKDFTLTGLQAVEEMMGLWNQALSTLDFFHLPASTTTDKNYSSLDSFKDDEMGIYKSTNWYDEIGSGALAVTQYFAYKRGTYLEMVHADIIINFKDFTYSLDDLIIGAYDFKTVVLHEMGHFIGLPHNRAFGSSIMYPYLATNESHRQVDNYDVNSLSALYQSSALTSSSALAFSATEQQSNDDNQEVVRGLIEMRADGSCRHYQNGQFIFAHPW